MRIILLLLISLFATSVIAQDTICNDLIWNDEFDYSGEPDTKKWGYDLGGGGWGNNELQTYTNSRDNSWVADGKLYIKAIKKNGSWTSARLVTRQKGDWLYGRIEVRAKVPSGTGIWSAIWMLPTDWAYGSWPKSGEIDIMEHVGYDVNRIYGTVHTESFNHTLGTQQGSNTLVPTAYTEFHDYIAEWDEEKIRIFVDDQLYFTFNNRYNTYKEWPFDKREHLLLNIAIGGSWGGAQGIDPNITEAIMEIEHVRVYELKPEKPEISGSGLVVPGQELTFSTKHNDNFTYNWTFPEGTEIISGEGTSTINVRWGENKGIVQVEMVSFCDTLISDPFDVKTTTSSNSFIIDNIENEEIQWIVKPTQNNTVSLEREGDEAVKVNFDVQKPTANPYIEYTFSTTFNFKDYSRLVINIKTEDGKSPSNMRVDLIDENGISDQGNLFKIDSVNASGNYETYAHIFGNGTSSFNIEKIKKVRIFFNYSVYGQPGTGYFVFSPIELKNASTSSKYIIDESVKFKPNPVDKYIDVINEKGSKIEIYDYSGTLILNSNIRNSFETIDVSGLGKGLYIILSIKENGIKRSLFIKK